jgi:hypothetical protein
VRAAVKPHPCTTHVVVTAPLVTFDTFRAFPLLMTLSERLLLTLR